MYLYVGARMKTLPEMASLFQVDFNEHSTLTPLSLSCMSQIYFVSVQIRCNSHIYPIRVD